MSQTTLGNLLGSEMVDKFEDFDLTEIQQVLKSLANENAIDLAHSDFLQQKSLYAANLLVDYLAQLVKSVSYLEGKVNSTKNRAALEYKSGESKITADMRRSASESDPEVEKLISILARAKGAKVMIENKLNILIKAHHFYKDVSSGMRRGMISMGGNSPAALQESNEQVNGETTWG